MDNQYYTLRKNAPFESELLSGENLPKRITNSPLAKGYLVYHQWVPKESLWSIPETLQQQSQQQHQVPKTKEKLNMVSSPGFNNYVVNELHQDV